MKPTPKVFVGVPAYNEQRYIAETLATIRDQTYRDIVVVVADNASTDRTVQVVEKFCAVDERFRLIVQPSNVGPYENFRKLQAMADAPYFMWAGAHDLLHRNYIEWAVDWLEKNPEYSAATPQFRFLLSQDQQIKVVTPAACNSTNTLLEPEARALSHIGSIIPGENIHSVFRTAVAQSLPLLPVYAADINFMTFVSWAGKTIESSEPYLFVRRVREIEAFDDLVARYRLGGMKKGENLLDVCLHSLLDYFSDKFTSDEQRLDFNKKVIIQFTGRHLKVYSYLLKNTDFQQVLQGRFKCCEEYLHYPG